MNPDLDIEAIRARAAAATPGPWRWYGVPSRPWSDLARPTNLPGGRSGHPHNVLKTTADWPPTDADAEFIANARADVSELLVEVDRLRAAVAAVGGVVVETHEFQARRIHSATREANGDTVVHMACWCGRLGEHPLHRLARPTPTGEGDPR